MPKTGTNANDRILFIDNLRIYLIVLVILHHVAVGYGGSGAWRIQETASDRISPILFLVFNAVNQSYFMSFFYLIGGYFLPASLDAKGPGKCMKDRLIRLGIPMLFYAFLISPAITWMVANGAQGLHVTPMQVVKQYVDERIVSIGPLWFVEGLLIFSGIYIFIHRRRGRSGARMQNEAADPAFPENRTVAAAIFAMAAATFAVRLVFPVGVWIYHFQLGHFVHYACCFGFGVLAWRGRWFERLSGVHAKFWGSVAVVNTGIFPLVVGFALSAGIGEDQFVGGFTAGSLFLSAWESINCISIMIALAWWFKKIFNRQGPLLRALSANAYTVYIIHEAVVVALMIALLRVRLHTVWKFSIVSTAGIAICFLAAHFLVRRTPGARWVLG